MATYYIDPSGSDSHTEAEAQNQSTPWATLGKAYTDADNTQDCTFICGAGDYYSEVEVVGGPDDGVTWEYQFNSSQTNVRLVTGEDTLWNRGNGKTGVVNFTGGSTGLTKVTKFDIGRRADGTNNTTNVSMWETPRLGAINNIRDIEINGGNGSGPNPAGEYGRLTEPNNNGKYTFERCLISHVNKLTLNPGHRYFYSNMFYISADNFMRTEDDADFHFINNTLYVTDAIGTGYIVPASNPHTGSIKILNNLCISTNANNVADIFFFNLRANTYTTFEMSNNWGWKTNVFSGSDRGMNSYYYTDNNGTGTAIVSRMMNIDPSFTGTINASGSGCTPVVSSSSMTIGRGATDSDVPTTDFENKAFPSNSVGAYAVTGGTKQYITKVDKLVLSTGDSWADNDTGQGYTGKADADARLDAYTFYRIPGATDYPGLSGNELTQGIRGIAAELCQRAGPSHILVTAGTNDFTAGELNYTEISQAMRDLADDLTDLYAPNDQPFFMTLGGQEDTVTPGADPAALEDMIDALFVGTPYINLNIMDNMLPSYVSADGRHLNGAGDTYAAGLVVDGILATEVIPTGSSYIGLTRFSRILNYIPRMTKVAGVVAPTPAPGGAFSNGFDGGYD